MDLLLLQRLALVEHQPLIQAALTTDPTSVSAVARLRGTYPADLVHAALQLAQARHKAQTKFPNLAQTLWADPPGVEMASSTLAAAHKAAHARRVLGPCRALDICCGIGGDAIAMVAAGLDVLCIDRDPARAWMAARNAGTEARCADASDVSIIDPHVRLLHIDPARRTEATAKRHFRLDDLQPPPTVVLALVETLAEHAGPHRWGAAVKLGPGLDDRQLSTIAGDHPAQIEFISEHGRLTQAVVWIGSLAPAQRSATLLTSIAPACTLTGTPGRPPPIAALQTYIYEPDDSIERAGLLAALCVHTSLHMPHPDVGLLSGDAFIAHPMLQPFELIADMPWNQHRVKQALDHAGAGIVEVKTRGKLVDPDTLQTQLRGTGTTTLTVFILRFGALPRALIARRLPRSQP